MLNENIKLKRKAKGLSQEELAAKLNVARQTLSKWEKGMSVPDAEMLIQIAKALDTSVSELLGESSASENDDTTKTLAAKLEVLNEQYSRSQEQKRKIWRAISVAVAVVGIIYLIDRVWTAGTIFRAMTNPHLGDTSNAQVTVSDVPQSVYNTMLWMSVRMILPPAVLCVLATIGICKTKKDK